MTRKFSERDRYDGLDLGPESVVLDIGAHTGTFAREIARIYNCFVYAFEPVPQFFSACFASCGNNPKIVLSKSAIGACASTKRFGVKGDMSGLFCGEPNESINVDVRDFKEVFESLGGRCDLAKINVEGSEFDILERAIEIGAIPHIKSISAQFHTVVPDYERRHDAIRAALEKTHDLEYDEPFIWTGWKRR